MSLIKTIRFVTISIFTVSIFGCSNPDDAKPIAEKFFNKIIAYRNFEAAKLIDSKAPIYSNRFNVIKGLKHNKQLGTLNSIGGGIYGSSTYVHSTIGFTKVQLQIKLNYDSTSVMANVVVVDRGNGFLITKIEL